MPVSFESPEDTTIRGVLGTLQILDVVRNLGLTDKARTFKACTSQRYGLVHEVSQN